MIDTLKGAIFDMDGTLINSLIIWDVIWSKLGEKYGGDPDFRPTEADDRAVRTMTLPAAMDFIHDAYKLGENGRQLLDTTDCIIEDFYANEVELKSGVIETLEYLKARGVKMCVASATDKRLLAIAMKHCGLDGYFSAVLSCADIGKGKDQPDIYLAALSHLGTANDETCIFEDSLTAIRTAVGIGLKTVAIYDACNYGQDEMARIADVYISEGESMNRLIK